MTPSSDAQLNASSSSLPEQGMELPRLFHFDLPPLKQTGQPFPEQTNISSIHHVLDIASGDGQWTISAAQTLPQVQFVGIEGQAGLVEQARAQAKQEGVTNVTFTLMDPFAPLDLPDGAFDLVNARYITGLLEAAAWRGRRFREVAGRFDVVVAQTLRSWTMKMLARADVRVIYDLYDPFLIGNLNLPPWERKEVGFPEDDTLPGRLCGFLLPSFNAAGDRFVREQAQVQQALYGVRAGRQPVEAREQQIVQGRLVRFIAHRRHR